MSRLLCCGNAHGFLLVSARTTLSLTKASCVLRIISRCTPDFSAHFATRSFVALIEFCRVCVLHAECARVCNRGFPGTNNQIHRLFRKSSFSGSGASVSCRAALSFASCRSIGREIALCLRSLSLNIVGIIADYARGILPNSVPKVLFDKQYPGSVRVAVSPIGDVWVWMWTSLGRVIIIYATDGTSTVVEAKTAEIKEIIEMQNGLIAFDQDSGDLACVPIGESGLGRKLVILNQTGKPTARFGLQHELQALRMDSSGIYLLSFPAPTYCMLSHIQNRDTKTLRALATWQIAPTERIQASISFAISPAEIFLLRRVGDGQQFQVRACVFS